MNTTQQSAALAAVEELARTARGRKLMPALAALAAAWPGLDSRGRQLVRVIAAELDDWPDTIGHRLAGHQEPTTAVAIEIRGGLVQDVHTNAPGLAVTVIDYDNAQDDDANATAAAAEALAACPYTIAAAEVF